MRPALLAALLAAVLALAAGPVVAQERAARVPLDGERTIGGVTVGCTGIGQSKSDPRWRAYPIRVEFAAPGGDYLADEALSISDHTGAILARVACEGPWVLLRPESAGDYTFKGWPTGAEAQAKGGSFRIPAKDQARLVLQFPTR
ncbi:MAG TPA: hypothetical protein VG166_01155 [Caulobacteraceae bacterium]|jgi:hypothetical protein|nr:hypothetical protein [Caulobacteraceae bacterium]